MLGEKIGSLTAATTNTPLPANGALPRFQTRAEGSGTLAGAEVKFIASYGSDMRADGTLYAECPNQGVVMTADGVATFTASGIGTFTADGGATFRGVCYFQTSAASLSSLNGKCVVYDWDVDAAGKATWELWEKKQTPSTFK